MSGDAPNKKISINNEIGCNQFVQEMKQIMNKLVCSKFIVEAYCGLGSY